MKRKFISLILLTVSLTLVGCNKQQSSSSNESKSSEESISESIEDSSEESSSEGKITEGTLKERLNQIERIKNVVSIGSTKNFGNVVTFKFEQYIDHNNKELGMFDQKVELGFNSYKSPTVFVTSGYMTMDNNSYYENNENELAFLLGCNYVFVEHRYFGKSVPVDLSGTNNSKWQYLTTKQSADDHHDIVEQLKRVLDGKWVSTGMSKGGMTTEMFSYYHPGDMDLYLPYVAPFCASFNDDSVWKFIYEEAGNLQYGEEKATKIRNEVLDFQVKLLEYRDDLATKYYQDGLTSHAQYSEYATADLIYDASVLEFAFGFWQYDQNYRSIEKCLAMAESTSKQNACYELFTSVVSASDYAVNSAYLPYYIQAYKELGNYAYDFSYIRNKLTDQSLLKVEQNNELSLFWKLVLSAEDSKLEHKELMNPKIENMLKTTTDNFIIIYGSSDPWYALRPADVTNRDNISIYVNTKHPHGANISNFDDETQEEIMTKIKTILEVE